MDIDFNGPNFVPPPPEDLSAQDQNWISPSGFILAIQRNKPLQFNCQRIEIPDVSLDIAQSPTPLIPINFVGHPLVFGQLVVEFKIDSGFKNYLELYKWMRAVGQRTNEGYKYLEEHSGIGDKKLYSDISVITLDNLNNPEFKFTFIHAFPTSLGRFTMESTVDDIHYLSTSATFSFLDYTLEPAS